MATKSLSKELTDSSNNDKTMRKRVQKYFVNPSLTKQEFKQECDINEIIRRFKATGELPQRPQGMYLDCTQIPDYQTMLDTVNAAQDLFATYPAEIRARFSNNPAFMLDWASDPRNREEAIQLGVLKSPDMPQPVKVPPAVVPTENKENLTKPLEK